MPEFNNDFEVTHFDRVQTLTLVSKSTLPLAQHIVIGVSVNENCLYKPPESSTINSEIDNVLFKPGKKQVARMFCGAFVIHTYTVLTNVTSLGRRSGSLSIQPLFNRVSKYSNLHSVHFRCNEKPSPLYVTDLPNVFEVIMWFHLLNFAFLSININYRSGNTIILSLNSMVIPCTTLLRCVAKELLST